MLTIDQSALPDGLRLGTSSFSSKDWIGSFYPEKTPPSDFLGHYAGQLGTVEVDATWYSIPAARTVEGWERKTPAGFTFSLKVPKTITHELSMVGCEKEWSLFWERVSLLGEKRGPLLFQFPYVAKGKDPDEYATGARFLERLATFLPTLSSEGRYVVEVRNRTWIKPPLVDLLRKHDVALALVDYYTMPRPTEIVKTIDVKTAGFGYVRLLGHHRRMNDLIAEARSEGNRENDWGSLLLNRTRETAEWVGVLKSLLKRQSEIFAYFNNHYAGFAPGSIDLFIRQWLLEQGGREPESA